MPFVCADHPAPGTLADILLAIQQAADDDAKAHGGVRRVPAVEIGIPFSDPVADGPVIAAAMHEALKQGSTPAGVFEQVRQARAKGLTLPLVAMVSISIVHRIGEEAFVRQACQAGFDGFIFPDVPLEESRRLRELAAASDATASLLVAPTTPAHRAVEIAKACTGFVYVLARSGITGDSGSRSAGSAPSPRLAERVAALRTATPLPLACGFGIAAAEHVRQTTAPSPAGAGADAAIVGSALVKRLTQAKGEGRSPAEAVRAFVQELLTGLPVEKGSK